MTGSGDRPDRRAEWMRRKFSKESTAPFIELLGQALADGQTHVIDVIADLDGDEHPIRDAGEARLVKNALYNSARRRTPDGTRECSIPYPDLIERPDGTWEVRFRVVPYADGCAHIQATPRDQWAYDPAASAAMPRPPRRRRPSARQIAGQQQVAASAAAYRQHLETRQPGEGSDIRDWLVDHGHRPPRNDRDRQIIAHIQATARQHQPAAAPAAETPAGRLASWWKSLT
jgi:hypothetical protein